MGSKIGNHHHHQHKNHPRHIKKNHCLKFIILENGRYKYDKPNDREPMDPAWIWENMSQTAQKHENGGQPNTHQCDPPQKLMISLRDIRTKTMGQSAEEPCQSHE